MPDGLNGRRVVVTGGRGFIGRHVVDRLHQEGAEAIPLGYPGTEVEGGAVPVDLEDPAAVHKALAGADAVVHLAARAGGIQFQSDGDETVFTVNRRMTDNVLTASRHHETPRLFLASSLVVYRPATTPLTESHPLLSDADQPSPYARSKVGDELAAVGHHGVTIGRFGNVYGPGGSFEPGRSTVIHALIDRALDSTGEIKVWGDGSVVRSFVFATDVARAVTLILATGESGMAYNVDSGESLTIAEVAGAVRDAIDPGLRIRFEPDRPAGPQMRVGDPTRLRSLGFGAPVPFAEGLHRTIAWRRNRG